ELPAAAQKAVRKEIGSGTIETIERKVRRGRTLYEVVYARDGQRSDLLIGEDGNVMNSGTSPARGLVTSPEAAVPLRDAKKVTFNDLPSAVQNTVRAQAGPAPIEDIDKGTLSGRVVYEAAFKRNGIHTELRVAEDGS